MKLDLHPHVSPDQIWSSMGRSWPQDPSTVTSCPKISCLSAGPWDSYGMALGWPETVDPNLPDPSSFAGTVLCAVRVVSDTVLYSASQQGDIKWNLRTTQCLGSSKFQKLNDEPRSYKNREFPNENFAAKLAMAARAHGHGAVRHWTELPVAIWNGLDTSSEPPRLPLGARNARFWGQKRRLLRDETWWNKKNLPSEHLELSLSTFLVLAIFLSLHVFPLTFLSLENSFPWHLLSLETSLPSHLFPLICSLHKSLFYSFPPLMLTISSLCHSVSMFYSCHHSWSFPFLSTFLL